MIVVDTGPLVAAALYKDPDYRRCVDLFTGLHLANRPMVIPAPVIAEVGYLVGTRAGAQAEAFFLRSLADGDFLWVGRTHATLLLGPSAGAKRQAERPSGGLARRS